MIGQELQPKMAFRTIKLIFYSLNTGLLIFFMVGVYMNEMQIPPFQDKIDILTIVNLLLTGVIPVVYLISAKKMDAIDPRIHFQRNSNNFRQQ